MLHAQAVYPRLVHITSALHSPPRSAVVFAPCPLGTSATTQTFVHNQSPIPLSFLVQLPEPLRDTVSVTPAEGVVPSGGLVTLAWRFTPSVLGELADTVQCLYTDAGHSEAAIGEQSAIVAVQGRCESGALQLTDSLVFEPVVVGRRMVKTVTLYNPTSVSISFTLSHDGGPSVNVSPSTVWTSRVFV